MQATGRADPLAAVQGQTVLVTEDEYFLGTAIVRSLRKAGAIVLGPFPVVEDALTAIKGGRWPDMALLDINLRGEMVYPLADLLRLRGVPLVFMTGYDRAALPQTYQDFQICDKPVNVNDFARKLAVAMGMSE